MDKGKGTSKTKIDFALQNYDKSILYQYDLLVCKVRKTLKCPIARVKNVDFF